MDSLNHEVWFILNQLPARCLLQILFRSPLSRVFAHRSQMKTKLLLLCLLSASISDSAIAQKPSPDNPLVDEIRPDADIISKLAATLAATLANQESKRKFSAEPFTANAAKAIFRDNRWQWNATVGYGKGDLQVTVSFKQDGSDPRIEIAKLVNVRGFR